MLLNLKQEGLSEVGISICAQLLGNYYCAELVCNKIKNTHFPHLTENFPINISSKH